MPEEDRKSLEGLDRALESAMKLGRGLTQTTSRLGAGEVLVVTSEDHGSDAQVLAGERVLLVVVATPWTCSTSTASRS